MKKVWEAIKKIGLAIAAVIAAMFGGVLLYQNREKILRCFVKQDLPSVGSDAWEKVDDKTINVLVNGKATPVALPEGIRALDIKAVQVMEKTSEVAVKVSYGATTRRGGI